MFYDLSDTVHYTFVLSLFQRPPNIHHQSSSDCVIWVDVERRKHGDELRKSPSDEDVCLLKFVSKRIEQSEISPSIGERSKYSK